MARDSQDCPPEEQRLLLNALADGELDAATALDRTRLGQRTRLCAPNTNAFRPPSLRCASCPSRCSATAFASGSKPWPAAAAEISVGGGGRPPPPAQGRRPAAGWRWPAAGASWRPRPWWAWCWRRRRPLADRAHRTDQLEAAITDSHRRSLLAANPVDVATSDQHTVKPWLDARLGVSPPAINLAGKGFQLVGGRVDVLGGRSVPSSYIVITST